MSELKPTDSRPKWLKDIQAPGTFREDIPIDGISYPYTIIQKGLAPGLPYSVGFPFESALMVSEDTQEEYRPFVLAHEVREKTLFAGLPETQRCPSALIAELFDVRHEIPEQYAAYLADRKQFFEALVGLYSLPEQASAVSEGFILGIKASSEFLDGALQIEMETGFCLDNAVQLAAYAHQGQLDKEGFPYILHVERVMNALEPYGESVQMVGILHDVIEDTDITFEDLETLGMPISIIKGVDSVTKREGEEYEKAVQRAKGNALGRLVKLADNRDNGNFNRLTKLPNANHDRLMHKYSKALDELTANDAWLQTQVPIIQSRIEAHYIQDSRIR